MSYKTNNQLDFFFSFFFSSKTKYIYNFPKPKSQTPKDSKRITTFTKSTTSDFNINHSILTTKYGDLNRKHPIQYFNEIKEIIFKYQHRENVIK